MLEILNTIAIWIWNPLFIILVGTGLYLTFRLKGVQFKYLFFSLKQAFGRHKEGGEGDISHFQALMTALAATIGIGNIVGVATAIALGGLGSLFWLWVTALIGMALKYSEAALALRYRVRDDKNEMAGGPMYYIAQGLGWKWLAMFFALFGAAATLFTGNIIQANSIALAVSSSTHISPWIVGIILAALTGTALLKGIQSIGRITSYLVPFMAAIYIVGCLIIIISNYIQIPGLINLIFSSAFTGQAAVGGFAGSTIMIAMQMGVTRGVLSNESGLGSAPIAAAAAKSDLPGRQALISMSGAFLSTVVCTFTALAIGLTGVLGSIGADGQQLNGALMTMAAFDTVLPFGGIIVMLATVLFGYSTIIGWAYYGEKCCEYMLGTKSIIFYRIIFTGFVLIGVAIPLNVAWVLADIANAFMALPNLIAITMLSGVVVAQKNEFFAKIKKDKKKEINIETEFSR